MHTIIDIQATPPCDQFHLEDLHSVSHSCETGQPLHIQSGWYLLTVPANMINREIHSVTINGWSLEEHIYTSWFEDHEGTRHQPATATWGKGTWHMWIHTEPGRMMHHNLRDIRSGDLGTDLTQHYELTVDRPIDLGKGWPAPLTEWFRAGQGPQWHRRHTLFTPWDRGHHDLGSIHRDELIDQCHTLPETWQYQPSESMLMHPDCAHNTMTAWSLRRHAELPFVDSQDIPQPEIRRVLSAIGITRVLNVMLQTLPPLMGFKPHVDDHWGRECSPYTEGPAVFIWDLADDSQGHLFKLGGVGCVPDLDRGVWFNQHRAPHGTVNCGHTDRPLLIIQGDRGIDFRANT